MDKRIEKNYFIYVLELKNNKYYVGKTSNVSSRIAEHISNIGSTWTKKYKPKKIVNLYKNCCAFDEDKYTIMYMAIFGIDNVRGGSFCSIDLTHSEKTVLKKMIDSASDKCYRCGSDEHFASECVEQKQEHRTDTKPISDAIIQWCKNMSECGDIYIFLDEVTNKQYEFKQCEMEITDIPHTKDKFVKRISKKHNATIFNYTVSALKFHVKMLETLKYVVVYNTDDMAVLYHVPDGNMMTESTKQTLISSIEMMLEKNKSQDM